MRIFFSFFYHYLFTNYGIITNVDESIIANKYLSLGVKLPSSYCASSIEIKKLSAHRIIPSFKHNIDSFSLSYDKLNGGSVAYSYNF